jgi:hypothetical protein
MFDINTVDLGKVRVHSFSKIMFPYQGIEIVSMEASCGCSTPTNDTNNSRIVVGYTAKPVPMHLVQKDQHDYRTSKTITVKYKILNDPDTTVRTIVLTFKAHVHSKL